VTQFKETDTFQDLQTKVYDDIVDVVLSYMKELGLSEDKLKQMSDNVYRDLFAVMSELGNQQIPGADIYADKMKSTLKEMSVLEAKIKGIAELEEKLHAMEATVRETAAPKEKVNAVAAHESGAEEMTSSEETPSDMELPELIFDSFDSIVGEEDDPEDETKDMDSTTANGVLDSDKAQDILKAAKATSA
jgi:hypothetical protein